MKSGYWLIPVAAACEILAVACSSPFDSCESARDCPVGGSNAGGTAGAGGAAPESLGGAGAGGAAEGGSGESAGAGRESSAPECTVDADCSDDLACTGVETCQAGACVPGAFPCANPEPLHCDAVCTELHGAAACAVQGQDRDADGHLSAACTVKPGDDCDDSSPTVYTGAPELCDGIDNNCNGKVDLADGLAVSGKAEEIGASSSATRSSPGIAWASDKSVYGVVWRDDSSTLGHAYFETFDQKGAQKVAPELVDEGLSPALVGPGVAFGGDSFGVAWADGSKVNFRQVSSAGVLAAHTIPVSGTYATAAPTIARVSGGNWALFWTENGRGGLLDVWGNTIDSGGTPGSEIYLGGAGGSSVAASGSSFVVTSDYNTRGTLYSSTLDTSVDLTLTGKLPVVGSGPKGFAIAVSGVLATDLPQFYAFKSDGTTQCGPVTIADASFTPASIVGTASGYVVVSSGVIRAQEILANCKLGVLFTIDANGAADSVSIAGSATGYGVVWQDTTASVPKRRLFGPDFCN